MHDLLILVNITVALVVAFIGGLIVRRIGLPTLVGYLLAGVVIGPFTPGFVGDVKTISELAELGVIFMMFGVGLHFSFRDLWSVRDIAVPGATLQTLTSSVLGFGLTRLWGWSVEAGIVLGLAISVASTVVLLRGLMDNGLLNTEHGRAAVGWLVFEDLATVLILVLMPAFFGSNGGNILETAGKALLGAIIFVGFMLFAGARFTPWLLTKISLTRSRELFILAVVALALGTAVGSSALFGVSLALGAFLAGVVIGESSVSHQVGAEILPFRETFAVLFFVSVGMLVNIDYLIANAGHVLLLTGLVIFGKSIITLLLGFILPRPAKTVIVVAAGLSQIGEFTFLVGQAGVSLGVLTQDQYSLILAGALLSIMFNPLMFKTIPLAEKVLHGIPWLWKVLDRHKQPAQIAPPALSGHVVVVGYGRVGQHIINALGQLEAPRLVVDNDANKIVELERMGVPTLYGDAANSEVLDYAGLSGAKALVVTLPDEAASEMVVAFSHTHAPDLPIVARAATGDGVKRLVALGARDVIYPELEGGVEVLRHTLLALGYEQPAVQQYADAARHE